ncbi:MAG: bile acid:sodium symporter family protein [Oligoflexus sp.]
MESNFITAIFLPVALGIIMLGMGLSLAPYHFRQVMVAPKPVLIGLLSQLCFLPLLAWVIALAVGLGPELAVGLVLIAACPGGPTSNLIAHLANGDSALSITLTALSSIIIIFTIPFIINAASLYFLGEGQYVSLPVLQTILQIFLVTILPVSIGMFINGKFPQLAKRCEKPVKVLSGFFLLLVIIGAILKERENILGFVAQVGVSTVCLNVGAMVFGYIVGRLFKLASQQIRTITIEVGIQNGTLGIAIASAPSLLNNSTMAIPAAIYSLLMFVTGAAIVFWSFKGNRAS